MNNNFNHNQQNELKITPSENSCKKPTFKKIDKNTFQTLMVIFMPIAIYVIILVILNANLLFPWQIEVRVNRKAILEYAAENHPTAKKTKEVYKSLNWNIFKSSSVDYIQFDQDGILFYVSAEGGEIFFDSYNGMRIYAQFDAIIQDGFMKPNGIIASTTYNIVDSYDIYPYTGRLGVIIYIIDQGSTPEEIGCLYDFFNYWKSEGAFLERYSVGISIVENHTRLYYINYSKEADFPSEAEFYAAFEPGP